MMEETNVRNEAISALIKVGENIKDDYDEFYSAMSTLLSHESFEAKISAIRVIPQIFKYLSKD